MSDDVHVIWLTRQPTVAVRFTCAPEEVAEKLGPALTEIGTYLHESKAEADAEGVYARFLGLGADYEVEAGYTLHEDLPGYGRVQPSELPDCEAAIVSHTGPYRGVADATSAIQEWMTANGREPGGAPWEVYLPDPEAESGGASQRQTEVYWPLKPKF